MKLKTRIVIIALGLVMLHNVSEYYFDGVTFNSGFRIENMYVNPDAFEQMCEPFPQQNIKYDWQVSGSTGTTIVVYP